MTLRKQSVAAAELREQLSRSMGITANDLGDMLSGIARDVKAAVASVHAKHPDKEDEYHYEEEAVDGTDDWDDGWFEEKDDA
jgi:hypothetical protein